MVEEYYEYEVIKPLPAMRGKTAPTFGDPCRCVKVLSTMEQRVIVEMIIDKGYLKEVH
ncbi:glycohydrolase toxin TNT-related protein [Pantoea sp. EEL5]|uniref:glycohydrolase toxin TNT-related protein n=1 Tax=Pantoea sp. EEL5 TaxID=3416806 RepID=UPI003CE69C42